MRSVTSSPLTPGRCRSHSTTSGLSLRICGKASSPLSASPTTSISVSPDRIMRIPARTKAWSSTTNTLIVILAPHVETRIEATRGVTGPQAQAAVKTFTARTFTAVRVSRRPLPVGTSAAHRPTRMQGHAGRMRAAQVSAPARTPRASHAPGVESVRLPPLPRTWIASFRWKSVDDGGGTVNGSRLRCRNSDIRVSRIMKRCRASGRRFQE